MSVSAVAKVVARVFHKYYKLRPISFTWAESYANEQSLLSSFQGRRDVALEPPPPPFLVHVFFLVKRVLEKTCEVFTRVGMKS